MIIIIIIIIIITIIIIIIIIITIPGLLRHPADCPRLFEGNKVKEKKDKFTGQ